MSLTKVAILYDRIRTGQENPTTTPPLTFLPVLPITADITSSEPKKSRISKKRDELGQLLQSAHDHEWDEEGDGASSDMECKWPFPSQPHDSPMPTVEWEAVKRSPYKQPHTTLVPKSPSSPSSPNGRTERHSPTEGIQASVTQWETFVCFCL
jgi:hypothetical protein